MPTLGPPWSGDLRASRRSRTLCVCLIPVPSAWSRSVARATRWTPKSSPPAWRRAAGRCGTRGRTRTSSSSTRAASSRRPSRSPSTSCSRPRTPAPRSPPSAAWPSATAPSLAEELPEAQVLSFDDYTDIAARLDDVLAGRKRARARGQGPPHAAAGEPGQPPAGPTERAQAPSRRPHRPPAGRRARLRPAGDPQAARGRRHRAAEDRLRLRPPLLVLRHPVLPRLVRLPAPARAAGRGRAGWPARASASWCWSARTPPPTARTWATCGCSRRCCPSWPRPTGIARVRVSYLQPAEVRPGLIDVMTSTPGVVPYFDLSFQHASGPVLRRMRRFGDRARFTRAGRAGQAAQPGRRASGPTSSSASPARRPTTCGSLSCS